MFGGLVGRILIRRVSNKEISIRTALHDKTAYDSALAEALVRCVLTTKQEAVQVYRCNKDLLSGETEVTHKGVRQSKLRCDPCKNEPYKTRLKAPDKDWDQIADISKNKG